MAQHMALIRNCAVYELARHNDLKQKLNGRELVWDTKRRKRFRNQSLTDYIKS